MALPNRLVAEKKNTIIKNPQKADACNFSTRGCKKNCGNIVSKQVSQILPHLPLFKQTESPASNSCYWLNHDSDVLDNPFWEIKRPLKCLETLFYVVM